MKEIKLRRRTPGEQQSYMQGYNRGLLNAYTEAVNLIAAHMPGAPFLKENRRDWQKKYETAILVQNILMENIKDVRRAMELEE